MTHRNFRKKLLKEVPAYSHDRTKHWR